MAVANYLLESLTIWDKINPNTNPSAVLTALEVIRHDLTEGVIESVYPHLRQRANPWDHTTRKT